VGEVTWTDEFKPWTVRTRAPANMDKPLSRYGIGLEERRIDPSASALHDGSYAAPTAVVEWAARALDDTLGTEPPISGADASAETMRVYAAARLSMAEGRSVRVSDLDADAFSARHSIP
jgi:hypothetical protein